MLHKVLRSKKSHINNPNFQTSHFYEKAQIVRLSVIRVISYKSANLERQPHFYLTMSLKLEKFHFSIKSITANPKCCDRLKYKRNLCFQF